MEFFGVNTSLRQEWVGSDGRAQFSTRSHNHRGREAKIADDPGFDLLAQRSRGTLGRLEHHIAALDVSLYLFEAQGFERLSQVVHLDSLVSPYVDAAQHGDVDGHSVREFVRV